MLRATWQCESRRFPPPDNFPLYTLSPLDISPLSLFPPGYFPLSPFPLFPHEVWNINSRVNNDLPRTNNSVEGWNRKMQSGLVIQIYGDFSMFWRENKVFRTPSLIDHLVVMQQSQVERSTVTVMHESKISSQTMENRDSLEFLRGIAHNLHL